MPEQPPPLPPAPPDDAEPIEVVYIGQASPTGTPLIPARYVPLLSALWLALASAAEMLPDGRPKQVIHVALVILGPLLGMVTPGLRRKP